jgi:hypothetical protein
MNSGFFLCQEKSKKCKRFHGAGSGPGCGIRIIAQPKRKVKYKIVKILEQELALDFITPQEKSQAQNCKVFKLLIFY